MRIFEKDGPRSAAVLLFYVPALVLLIIITSLKLLWPFRAWRDRQLITLKDLSRALATILYRLIRDVIPSDLARYSVSVTDWPVRSPYYKTVDLDLTEQIRRPVVGTALRAGFLALAILSAIGLCWIIAEPCNGRAITIGSMLVAGCR